MKKHDVFEIILFIWIGFVILSLILAFIFKFYIAVKLFTNPDIPDWVKTLLLYLRGVGK